MIVTFLVTAFSTYAGQTVNHVEVQPSWEICLEAKKIHLEIPRETSAFDNIRDISKPTLVDCIRREVPTKSE